MVIRLLTPPQTIRYNRSAEAGIGSSSKTRTFYQAMGHGAYNWTSDDAEAARQQSDLTPQSYGGGLFCTPEDRWRQRLAIPTTQREAGLRGPSMAGTGCKK